MRKNRSNSEPSEGIYSTFPEFQREEMNKIIEEQRQEIEHLETQLRSQADSALL